MVTRILASALFCAALTGVPGGAAAQAQAQPPAPDFRSLFTGWSSANSSSMRIEQNEVDRVRQDYTTAGSERRQALRSQGRNLGERVGEIVRSGDCAEGERVAREAGDFALVEAVRDHCEAADPDL
jgi:hypothetical protein